MFILNVGNYRRAYMTPKPIRIPSSSPTLKPQISYRSVVSENKVMETVLGQKRDKFAGGWKTIT